MRMMKKRKEKRKAEKDKEIVLVLGYRVRQTTERDADFVRSSFFIFFPCPSLCCSRAGFGDV